MAASDTRPKLFLKVITRQGVLFNAEITSLSSANATGPFDVLKEHTQFISIIKDKIIIRLPDGKVQEMPVDNGVMRVKGQIIQVFLGIKQ